MMTKRLAAFLACSLLVGLATPAWAYVGPGAGLSLMAALWGVAAAIAAAVGFLVFWPLRRALRRQRTAPPTAGGTVRQTSPDLPHRR